MSKFTVNEKTEARAEIRRLLREAKQYEQSVSLNYLVKSTREKAQLIARYYDLERMISK